MIGILIVLGALLLVYLLNRRKMSYWKRLGIPQTSTLPFIGNGLSALTCQTGLGEVYEDIYNKHKDKKYVGFYHFWEPLILINDVKIIEKVFATDFSIFMDKGFAAVDPKSEVDFMLNLLTGNIWRGLRYKMAPAYSVGKIKLMFDHMHSCAVTSRKYLESIPPDEVDFTDVSTRFSMDLIASCAFGLDVSKDIEAGTEFRKMTQQIIMGSSTFVYYCQLIFLFIPKLAGMLGLSITAGEVGEYFAKIIKDTFNLRLKSGEKRQDLIDHLLALKEEETITVHSKDPEDKYLHMDNIPSSETFKITDNMLISQAFTFIISGLSGLSVFTTYALHELAKEPLLQKRVREELREQVAKQGGVINYEALKNCDYLEWCINDVMRLHPLVTYLMRQTSQDYEIEPGVKIEAGTRVVICVSGLHQNPDYYREPDKFLPERFKTEPVSSFVYLPFGAGPRTCIGMRLALMVIKLFLATVLTEYEVRLSPECPRKIEKNIKSLLSMPRDKLTFSITKLNS